MAEPTSLLAFSNEPVLELRRSTVRQQLAGALEALDSQLPLDVPVMIASDRRGDQEHVSTDPGHPERVVAHVSAAREPEVAEAVARAADGHRAWSALGAAERARALMGAAAWLRERRLEMAALEVRECAKPWPEADGDVCEAIDFLEYYARGALALAAPRPVLQAPGEHNELRLVPRGVVAVISPWNFPIAIPCGMTAGALAA